LLAPGTYVLGPDSGTLTVRTRKGGAAAKAGHDLQIEVTRWNATLEVGEESAITLSADARSLRVVKGSGGMSPLGDDEKAGIAKTIDDDVLEGKAIEFRSTRVQADGDRLAVEGELELSGARRPLGFELSVGDDGRLTGEAQVKQTDWGMKPYSALFGTLKVLDVVKVEVDANARSRSDG
jgi:polyisoprenoid-binding protein YceI